ncbi:MAG: hypothetical protein Q8P12_00105, partial [bacterium]|nr:hypothetical protein [bacterium]
MLFSVLLLASFLGIARHTQAIAREERLSVYFDTLIERQEPFAFSGTIVQDPEERRGSNHLVVAPDGKEGRILLGTDAFS